MKDIFRKKEFIFLLSRFLFTKYGFNGTMQSAKFCFGDALSGGSMEFDFDVEKLRKAVDDFYYATGVEIFIAVRNCTGITGRHPHKEIYCDRIREIPQEYLRCQQSDEVLVEKCSRSGKPEMHICQGGLVNIIAPIINQGEIVGYIYFYSLRQKDSSDAEHYIADLPLPPADRQKMREYYEAIPVYEEKRFESVISLAVLLAQYIIFENLIRPAADGILNLAQRYIRINLSRKLTVREITRAAGTSKTVLYDLFRRELGCTVSEYVNDCRIHAAERMLRETELSIGEISARVGFSSPVYFRSVFKKKHQITPGEYRKQKTDENREL